MAVRHTTTIRASITAYSTAVGPSSEARKGLTLLVKACIGEFLCCCISLICNRDSKRIVHHAEPPAPEGKNSLISALIIRNTAQTRRRGIKSQAASAEAAGADALRG